MLRYREEEAEAGANGTKKPTTAKHNDRSMSISIAIKKEGKRERERDLSSLVSAAPPAILSARQVFATPRFSSDRADDGCRRPVVPPPRILVLVANTRGITRKVCAGEHRRSLPFAARQEATKTNFCGRRRGHHVVRITVCSADIRRGEEWQLCREIKKSFKINFYERNNVRVALGSELVNFCFTKRDSTAFIIYTASNETLI